MAKTDDLIRDIADRIFHSEGYFLYKGYKYLIMDEEYASPMDMRELTVLRIVCPMPYTQDGARYLNVTYEKQWMSREEEIETRTRACVRLATDFVMGVLPKIDFEIKKEVNNYEVEKILEVLDD